MSRERRIALIAGVLYLVTHLTSVGALALYGPILDDPDYVLGSGADPRALAGGLLEVVLAMSVIGTAVTLWPVTRRQSEAVALGYLGLRVLEASLIVVGVVALLGVVTLRGQAAASADAGALVAVGEALVAVHDWTFLLGPSFILGVSTISLAALMLRSRLVPRWIGVLGLIGGLLVLVQAPAVMFGVFDQVSAWGAITALPVFAWEISLALWLVIRGFRPEALARLGAVERDVVSA